MDAIKSACPCALRPSTRQQDHGWATLTGDGKVGMKIVIERDANPARIPSGLEDLLILSLSQTHLIHVDEEDGRARRQPPIEQNLDHATRSIPRLSSSTVAAA